MILVGLWLLTLSALAEDRRQFHYIDFGAIPQRQLLGDPPPNDSPRTTAELEEILEWQRTRSAEEVTRARAEARLTPYIFSEALGPWFNPGNLPVTDALLKKTQADLRGILDQTKNLWNRPRPSTQDARVKPAIEVLGGSAYPSGHATIGTCLGYVLAEIAPMYRKEILQRAELIGQDRVIAGVHYSSDIVAGNTLGLYIAERLLEDPAFRAELAKSRREMQPFFHLHGE
jgi:acid phosphatase (class A)